MSTAVGRVYRFRAVHSLPDFREPWCFPHEHDYRVEVEAEGGVDTDRLDRVWEGIDITVDLNAFVTPSTVEAIAEKILLRFIEFVPEMHMVTVWEDDARWGRAIAA
jgi:6-pyruvoyl-tetrahydropterin synthase